MPHQFTQSSDEAIQGVWHKHNGRRYCVWHFDPDTQVLQAKRGVVVQAATLEGETRSLEELKNELPTMALQLAKRADSA